MHFKFLGIISICILLQQSCFAQESKTKLILGLNYTLLTHNISKLTNNLGEFGIGVKIKERVDLMTNLSLFSSNPKISGYASGEKMDYLAIGIQANYRMLNKRISPIIGAGYGRGLILYDYSLISVNADLSPKRPDDLGYNVSFVNAKSIYWIDLMSDLSMKNWHFFGGLNLSTRRVHGKGSYGTDWWVPGIGIKLGVNYSFGFSKKT